MQTPCCSVIELRQYTTHPGQRDVLIELFDREFVETQEEHGIHVVGQFTDLDRSDKFVWLRGFRDMTSRAQALQAFYGGPVWKKHREAANATMLDSDNVLLLRPAAPGAGLPHLAPTRPPTGSPETSASVVEVTICPLAAAADTSLLRSATDVLTDLRGSDHPVYCYATETATNTFPALPVRAEENVLVWLTRHDPAASGTPADRIVEASAALEPYFSGAPERLRLHPTRRSELR